MYLLPALCPAASYDIGRVLQQIVLRSPCRFISVRALSGMFISGAYH